jgi:hypothetical protein
MSSTGRCRYSGTSWATNAIRFSASEDPAARPPSTVTRPSVGATRPMAMCISVVFPAPFGPVSAVTRPAGMASVQSRTAQVFQYRRPSLAVSMTFMPSGPPRRAVPR